MNTEIKTASEIAEFEASTGWSWTDAVDESLEHDRAFLLGSKTDEEKAEFEASTGWTWEDAVDETLAQKRRVLLTNVDSDVEFESDEERFERETGWTYGDAVMMAAELNRERRIFGRVA